MSKKEITLVYYYVPEDKDDPDLPNIFGIPIAKANIKLADIHAHFPLRGSYIYRFKFNNQGTIVWLDLPTLDSKIPLFQNKIIVKATRVSWQDGKLHAQYKQKNIPNPQNMTKKQSNNIFDSPPKIQKKIQQPVINNISNMDFLQTSSISTNQNYPSINLLGGVSKSSAQGLNLLGQQISHNKQSGDLI